MPSTYFDGLDLMKVLNNTVDYTRSYLMEVSAGQAKFNSQLAVYIKGILNQYIDSQARLYPERLAHVYEPGFPGAAGQRLFKFETVSTMDSITFTARFSPSTLPSVEGGTPFALRASIMEDDVSVTIKPKTGKVLVFDDNGETVFTSQPVTIDHPGGPEAAGAFKETIDSFFNGYLTHVVLAPVLAKLARSKAYGQYFKSGTKNPVGAGKTAAREFLGGITE